MAEKQKDTCDGCLTPEKTLIDHLCHDCRKAMFLPIKRDTSRIMDMIKMELLIGRKNFWHKSYGPRD